MKQALVFVAVLFLAVPGLQAAPIGVPGASLGADESSVGLELNFLVDRDLEPKGDTEGMTVLAKGELGISKRLDLIFRAGFGRFENGGEDSDAGLVFGTGAKVTWASIPDLKVKIGSVAQVLQIRADFDGSRQSYTAYDFAVGAYLDPGMSKAKSEKKTHLATYGGLVFSSVDIESSNAVAKEGNSIGAFMGLIMNLNRGLQAGLELRLLDQTALSLSTSYAF